MIEHVFVISGDVLADDARATERAATLTERILDEVSRARHSWRAIERLASSLHQLAAAMAKLTEPPPDPPQAAGPG